MEMTASKSWEKIQKSFLQFTIIQKKFIQNNAIVFVRNNENEEQRFGFVASKKTGNAVQRNRIKRLFREFVKENGQNLKKNSDYVFVGKSILKENIKNIKYKDIEKDLLKVTKKMKQILLFLIKIYQNFFQELFGRRCRFYPTCSEYSRQAITKYGAIKGTFLSVKRILKCHPFHKGGYDPLK